MVDVEKCLTCGCHHPHDSHGDHRNITIEDVQEAARAAGISLQQAWANMRHTLPIASPPHDDASKAEFLLLLTKSSDLVLAESAQRALDGMALKWTFNPNQSRQHGRFAAGTGQNVTNGQQKPAVKPINGAAAANTAGARPVNPAAARLTPKPALAKPAVTPAGQPAAQEHPQQPQQHQHPREGTTTANGQTLTIEHRATAETRGRDAQARAKDQADMTAIRVEMRGIRAALAAHKDPKPLTAKQVQKAVDEMCKKHGIPTSTKGLSAKGRAAVTAMRAAFRAEVHAKANAAKYQSRADAINKQLKSAKSDTAKAYLKARLSQANAHVKTYKDHVAAAQDAFAKARKHWHQSSAHSGSSRSSSSYHSGVTGPDWGLTPEERRRAAEIYNEENHGG